MHAPGIAPPKPAHFSQNSAKKSFFFSVLKKLLFVENFTIPASNPIFDPGYHSDETENPENLQPNYYNNIWSPGIGFCQDVEITESILTNRIEVLRLLLILIVNDKFNVYDFDFNLPLFSSLVNSVMTTAVQMDMDKESNITKNLMKKYIKISLLVLNNLILKDSKQLIHAELKHQNLASQAESGGSAPSKKLPAFQYTFAEFASKIIYTQDFKFLASGFISLLKISEFNNNSVDKLAYNSVDNFIESKNCIEKSNSTMKIPDNLKKNGENSGNLSGKNQNSGSFLSSKIKDVENMTQADKNMAQKLLPKNFSSGSNLSLSESQNPTENSNSKLSQRGLASGNSTAALPKDMNHFPNTFKRRLKFTNLSDQVVLLLYNFLILNRNFTTWFIKNDSYYEEGNNLIKSANKYQANHKNLKNSGPKNSIFDQILTGLLLQFYYKPLVRFPIAKIILLRVNFLLGIWFF